MAMKQKFTRTFKSIFGGFLVILLWPSAVNAQTVAKLYDPGASITIDACGNYCSSLGGVSFAQSEFSNCLITDVNVYINWTKTDGSCSSPTTGNSYHDETSFRLDGPDGTQVILAQPGTWSGAASTSATYTTFDQSAGGIPSGTPVTGTFRPNNGNLNSFNGKSPVGTWYLRAGDNAPLDPLCIHYYYVEVTVSTPLGSSVISQTNVGCNGASTGSLTAQGNNGTAPYSYSWSNGSISATINSLAAGTYTVTVTDVNNCPSSSSIALVTVMDSIAPVVVSKNITVFLDSMGSVTVEGIDLDSASSDTCGIDTFYLSTSTFDCSDIGSNAVTLFAEDLFGNVGSASATITVVDDIAPTIQVSDFNAYLDSSGNFTLQPSMLDQGTWDSCGISSLAVSLSNFDCSNVGDTFMVYLTATDVNGNSEVDSALVYVHDSIAPAVLTNNLTIALDSFGTASITLSQVNNGTWDSCGVDSIYLDIQNFDCSSVGAHTVTLSAVDIHGNGSSNTATITVIDTILPIAIAQNITIYLDSFGQYTPDPSEIDSGSNDGCGISSYALDITNLSCADIGSPVSVVLTVTDSNGNSNSASSTVTVLDAIAPTIITQNITVILDTDGLASITAAQLDSATWDSCGLDTIYLSEYNFDCSSLGAYTITFYAQDIHGNLDSSDVQVTVLEIILPTVITRDISVSLDSFGSATITANMIDSASFDGCGIDTMWLDNYDFGCGNVGTNVVTLYVEDVGGNIDSATATVSVSDSIAPNPILQNLTIQLDSFGAASIVALDLDNGSWDSCGIASYTIDSSNFSCLNVGTPVTVTLTLTDVNGNTSSDQTLVTIQDVIAPRVITRDLIVYLDSSGGATITTAMVDSASWDSCGIMSYSLSQTDFSCADIGTNVVSLSALDIHSNTSSANATIIVFDTIGPKVITQNITVSLDSFGVVSIDSSQINNGSWDSCGIASMTLDIANFSCLDTGVNTVTVTATDNNGNSTIGSTQVTVIDNMSPNVITQNPTIYLSASGTASINVGVIDNGSTDNCAIDTLYLDQTNFTCADTTSQTVTLTAIDISGNIGLNTAIVTILDTIRPTVLTQNISVYLDQNGEANFTANDVDNGSFDNCAVDSLYLSESVFYCDDTSFTQTVTLFAKDVSGNTNSAAASVQIFDTVSPVVNAQTLIIFLDFFGNANISPSQIDSNSLDNCGIDSTWISQNQFDCSHVGDTVSVSLFVVDISGNMSSDSAFVIAKDTIAPEVAIQNITVYIDSFGTASVGTAMINNGSWDACGIDSFYLDVYTFGCGDIGNNTVTLFARDVNGNIGSNTSTVAVVDTIAPTIVLQNLVIYLDSLGQASITSESLNNGTWDSCGIASITIDSGAFDCASHGDTITIHFTAVDIYGNSSFDSALVFVLDSLPPLVLAISDTFYLDSSGNLVVDVNALNNSTVDNCTMGTIHLSDSIFDCSSVYSNNLVWFVATDIFGNSDSIQVGITVLDTIAPVITCADTLTVVNDSGDCGAIIAFNWPSNWDNCTMDSLVQIDSIGLESGQFFPIGLTILTYVAIDQSGNTDTCSFTVEVRDAENPILLCLADTSICDSTFEFSFPEYTDNCGGLDVIKIAGIDSGEFYPVGTTVNTFTVSDAYGNADTCSFEVTRYDFPTKAYAGLDAELCEETEVSISAIPPTVGAGHWTLASDTAIIGDANASTTLITALTFGETRLVWNISNGVCPVERDTMSILVFSNAADGNAGTDQIVCDTGFAQLNASEASVGFGYWTALDANTSISDSLLADPIVSGLSLGDFKFVWTIQNGICPFTPDTVAISVKPYPIVTASADIFIFSPSGVEVSASSDLSTTVEWFPKTAITNDMEFTAKVNPPKTTYYIVYGTTEFGCTSSDTVRVGVNIDLKVPTAFTPDSDGVNDVWNLKELAAYPDCNVAIYNRWGNKMYESDGYEIPWDGTFKGEALPGGAYFFVINLNVGEVDPLTGSITIIK
jgi:gliding motility-associated-like protein